MTDEALVALRAAGRALDDLAARLTTALQGAAGATGSDPTATVRVALDLRGRVDVVTLSPGWLRSVGTAGLVAALSAARSDAGRQFVERLDTALGDPGTPAAAPPGDRPPGPGPSPGGLFDLRGVADATQDLRRQVRDLERTGSGPTGGGSTGGEWTVAGGPAPVVGRDPGRRVEVSLLGDLVESVTFAPGVTSAATERELSDALTAAVRDAYARADAQGPRRVLTGRAFTELSALLGDEHRIAELFRPPARGRAR